MLENNILNIALAVVGVILLMLALIVYFSNKQQLLNRMFAIFLLCGFLWLISNLATNLSDSSTIALFFARTSLIGALLFVYFYVLFCYAWYRRSVSKTASAALALPVLPLMAVAYTPLNISSIQPYGENASIGAVYLILIPLIIIYFCYGTWLLGKSYTRSSSIRRYQLRYIFAGLALTFIPAIMTNGVLLLLGGSDSAAYGPVFIIFFSVFATIAIVRHKLLDIRPVVVRTLAYFLSLLVLAIIYVVFLFGFTLFVSSDSELTAGQQIGYLLAALVLAFTFQPLKNFFDKVTDRIFFRQDYDSQEVIRKIGDIIIDETELHSVCRESAATILDALKSESAVYYVLSKQKHNYKINKGKITKKASENINEALVTAASSGRETVHIVEFLDDSDDTLRKCMVAANVSLSLKLQTSREVVGYLFLSQKKNGDIYNSKDVQLLSAIGKELALAIQNSLRLQEINDFNSTLQVKIRDATVQLRRTNAKLQQLDEAKDEFVSMASHQLRTPLTSVKGYLSMVLEGDAGELNPTQRKLLEEAYGSSQRMVYLVSDFLNVSRIKTGKFMLEYAESNLAEIIGEEISQLKATAEARNIKFIYDAPKSFPAARFDENKIRQVIMNLSDNAIYYSRPGGTVTVELFTKSDQIVFRVKDEGIGVPASERKDLFEKFYRASNARKVRPDGTGIGLFMIKKVIIAHGGSIIFESIEGKGSTFGFTLPRRVS